MGVVGQVRDVARLEAERAVARAASRSAAPRLATVTAVSPLTVAFWGDATTTVEVDRLAHYTPSVNDTVQVVRVGARWVVQGQVTS